MAKPYFLVEKLPKEFGGWEKTIISILEEPISKEERSEKIVTLLKAPDFDAIVSQLPKNFRARAKKLLQDLQGAFTLNENLHVIYPSGEIGASIIDHLKFIYLSNSKPEDASKFAKLLPKRPVKKPNISKTWRFL